MDVFGACFVRAASCALCKPRRSGACFRRAATSALRKPRRSRACFGHLVGGPAFGTQSADAPSNKPPWQFCSGAYPRKKGTGDSAYDSRDAQSFVMKICAGARAHSTFWPWGVLLIPMVLVGRLIARPAWVRHTQGASCLAPRMPMHSGASVGHVHSHGHVYMY